MRVRLFVRTSKLGVIRVIESSRAATYSGITRRALVGIALETRPAVGPDGFFSGIRSEGPEKAEHSREQRLAGSNLRSGS
jgi:hypothetical protein